MIFLTDHLFQGLETRQGRANGEGASHLIFRRLRKRQHLQNDHNEQSLFTYRHSAQEIGPRRFAARPAELGVDMPGIQVSVQGGFASYPCL